jgi:uncharacterized protein (DUF2267 family)
MSEAPLDERRLVRRIEALSGLSDAASVQRAARAVSSVLLEQLPPVDRTWLLHTLPQPWSDRAARQALPLRDGDALEDFYARVAAREGTQDGFAREHAQSVCRALAEHLDEDARRRLAARLPDAVATLLALPEPPSGAAPTVHNPEVPRHAQTLAEGKPGSRHPLSEAAPQRAQEGSVVRSNNPHGDTKLSSSSGTTQERLAETLARARPKT